MKIYKEIPEKFHNQFMETVAILEQKDNENEPLFTFKKKTKNFLFGIMTGISWTP